ncbi:MAG: hypothetical protein M3373_13790 [Gemmatimonadota bacterium]|nr:hypothetical protein [Gemmatimonadota bacterium]
MTSSSADNPPRPPRPTPSDVVPPELVARLRAALESNDIAGDHLQVAVRDFVGDLKRRGAPPEHALMAVKYAVRAVFDRSPPDDATVAALDRTIRWCVDEYYRE